MKTTIISILFSVVLVGGAILFSQKTPSNGSIQNGNNIKLEDDKQIITISAKGGYSPRVTEAKANTPTVLKVSTSGTFDCSSALVIPSLSYQANLPPGGITEIEIPPQPPGSKIQGLCAMGMYNFTLNFQ